MDGLVQDYSNSIANVLELLQSCTFALSHQIMFPLPQATAVLGYVLYNKVEI